MTRRTARKAAAPRCSERGADRVPKWQPGARPAPYRSGVGRSGPPTSRSRVAVAATVLLAAVLALAGAPPAGAATRSTPAAGPPGAVTARSGLFGAGACADPVPSQVRPDYRIADPSCDADTGAAFRPLTDPSGAPLSRVHSGILGGASWRVEVPLRWNGDVVLFAHGNHPTPGLVYVESPGQLRDTLIGQGFAWAASSYRANDFAIGEAVEDSVTALRTAEALLDRAPRSVYVYGVSIGGLITTVLLEQHPGTFAGALPTCGLLAETRFLDYLLDTAVTAAAVTRTPLEFPADPPAGYPATYTAQVKATLAALGSGFARQSPPELTRAGELWGAAVQQRSGGTRPGFAEAFAYWNGVPGVPILDPGMADIPLLLSLYPGLDGGRVGVADGNLADNKSTAYRLHDGPVTLDEIALNARVLRVERTARPWYTQHNGIMGNRGRPGVPVLALSGVGDLLTPLSLQQEYTRRVRGNRQGHLLVNRAVRTAGHCDFSRAELDRAFADLVRWVRAGTPPAGDDVLDPTAVADPGFGCRFTDGEHVGWSVPCPSRPPYALGG